MTFGYYKNFLYTHKYKFSSEKKKKKTGKESQIIVSRPELGSDSPFGSDRELGVTLSISYPLCMEFLGNVIYQMLPMSKS